MRRIKDIYKDHPFDTQVKAPMLQIALFSISLLSLLIIVSDVFSRSPLTRLIIHLCIVFFIVLSLLLVHRGYYHPMGDIFFVVLTLLFIILRLLNNPLGDHSLSFFTSIIGAFVVLSSVFIENVKLLVFLVISYVLSYTGLILRIHISQAWQTERVSAPEQILYSGVAMISVCISILLIRSVFDKVLLSTNEKMEELELFSDKNKKLISESASQLGKAGQLRTEADRTLEFSGKMQSLSQNLSDNMNHLNDRLEDSGEALIVVDRAIEDLRDIAGNQSSQVTQSSASIEEMAASIKSVSQIVQSKLDAVEELQQDAARGRSIMNQTHTAFTKAAELLENIKKMTGVISGIAAQTSLLAMNAAIEAAHAGDSGRGFAVVAAEIRKLSESSSANAKLIDNTVREMISAIENTGIQVNESDQAFQRIASEIGTVGNSMQEISNSTEELNTGSQEILTSVSFLNDITQKLVEHVNNVATSSARVYADLQDIRKISEDTGAMSHSSSEESLKLKESSQIMEGLCRELLDQSRKLNEEMQDQKM